MARTYDRFLRQRLSRRRLLAGASGTALGAAALAACGGGGGGGDAVSSGTPAATAVTTPEEMITKDGIRHAAHTQVLPSLNVFGATALAPAGVFGPSLFDHLWFVPLDTQSVEPLLATTIENPDEQGLEIICTIQDSVFHDKPPANGRPVVARDVKVSWEAFAADLLAPGHGWYREHFESIEAPDEHTVVIRQNAPYAWVFHPSGAGSSAWSSIMPEEALDPEMFDLSRDIIGSGRFFLKTNRSGEFFELERFANWRVEGEPFLAGSDSKLVSESAAAQAAFRAGEIDSVSFSNIIEADQMKDDLGDKIIITTQQARNYHTIMLKMAPPFDDIRVRKAVRLAIDRKALIQGVELDSNNGVPAGPLPPAQTAYTLPEDETADYYRHDPVEARALLEQADFPFDQTFTLKFFSSEEEQKRALLLKEQFGAVGIDVRTEGEDLLSVWLPVTLPQGNFDMTAYTQLSYDDPAIPLGFFTTKSALGVEGPQGRNNMDFFDEEITAAVDAVNLELNDEARIEKVKSTVRLIQAKEAPMINLYAPFSNSARWHWLKGLVTGRGGFNSFNGRSWIDTSLRGS